VRRSVPLLAALALAGCGADARPGTSPRVKLDLAAPADGGMLRAESVEVRGTVEPSGAAVVVAGQPAKVDGGTFTATVALQPGGNVIDVTASSPGHRPASDALRVVRDMRVELPKLAGYDEADAFSRLKELGLRPVEERTDNWLQRLIPGDVNVCATAPRDGTLVQPHSRVTVLVSRNC
jgi:Glucodextranase, domain B/PASTA domain